MGVQLVQGLLFHRHRLDQLGLHLEHALDDVLDRRFDLVRSVSKSTNPAPWEIFLHTDGSRVPFDQVAPGPTMVK